MVFKNLDKDYHHQIKALLSIAKKEENNFIVVGATSYKNEELITDLMQEILYNFDKQIQLFFLQISYQEKDRMIKYFIRIIKRYIYDLHIYISEAIKNI